MSGINWLGTCADLMHRREEFSERYELLHRVLFHYRLVHHIGLCGDTVVVHVFDLETYISEAVMPYPYSALSNLVLSRERYLFGFKIEFRQVER